MAPHSSTLAWKILWMEEPGRLQSVHGVVKSRTRLSDFTFTFHFHALGKEMATHSSVLAWRIPGTGGAWWAAVYGVAQSRTQLKRLGSSSSKSKVSWKWKVLKKAWELNIKWQINIFHMNKRAMFCGLPVISVTSPSGLCLFTGFTFKSFSYVGQDLDCLVFIADF